MILYQIVRSFVGSLLSILQLAMLASAIISWIPSLRGSALSNFIYQLTEPVIYPFRRLFRRFWPQAEQFPLDLAFLAAFVTISTFSRYI